MGMWILFCSLVLLVEMSKHVWWRCVIEATCILDSLHHLFLVNNVSPIIVVVKWKQNPITMLAISFYIGSISYEWCVQPHVSQQHSTEVTIILNGLAVSVHKSRLRGHHIWHALSNYFKGDICIWRRPDVSQAVELLQQIIESNNHIGEIMNLHEEQQILNWFLSFVVLSDTQILFCVVPDDKSFKYCKLFSTAIYKCW